jgi:Ser/Thr protein kinase RdoA (MazF antagonist)
MLPSGKTSGMTTTRASVTAAPAGLAAAVAERYGVVVAVLSQLEGGETGETYRGAGIVVRWSSEPLDADDVTWEHDLVTTLAAVVPEVVAPLRARDGSTWFSYDGRPVAVYPFVTGARAERTPEHAALAGAFVARLHRASSAVATDPPPQRPPLMSLRWADEAEELPAPLVPHADAIAGARAEALLIVNALRARHLETGPIHNDLYPRNVLVEGGRIVGIVDWAEARLDWLAYDVANAMWEFCHVGDELAATHTRAFLEAYRGAGGTLTDEGVLLPLVRVRRAVEIMQAARGDATDDAYTLHNLRALDGLRG